MATGLEELRVLQTVEGLADGLWKHVVRWEAFQRDTVGQQLTRAADSIGANIAEAFGRFHYGEKLRFLYIARGSLFETKYWLNRALARQLLPAAEVEAYAGQLSEVGRQLNAFANNLKQQKKRQSNAARTTREPDPEYLSISTTLFSKQDLAYLTNRQSPISNLHTSPPTE